MDGLVEWLPDSSEKPGEDVVRMVCAGLAANSRNHSLIEIHKLIAQNKSYKLYVISVYNLKLKTINFKLKKMILSDTRILEEIDKGTIKLVPYDRECLGSNSYDVHLGKWLATYREHILDAKKHNEIEYFEIPEDGFVLYPHIFYLGVTQEYTETHAHVPFLEGKSSTGRLGIDIHATAGKGDVGFCGNWTLEISVKQPVKVYKGMPIGQLIYFPVDGEIEVKYNQKKNAKYSQQPDKPIESMMWKNQF